ncbi:SHOCT domain-containing protein [Sutcliffiella halmapala]|uniref:SHOCT domain-containing protein n=1 Tax=Sutcliffiella halmapala TaxID=79882 RepID=UPI000995068D|nr:SHOCT domain-containing protein [Sutcliffiella halmapala]
MGFKRWLKEGFNDLLKKQVKLSVISGANQIFAINAKNITMKEVNEEGEVTFGTDKTYYFMGVDWGESSTRNVGKAAAGAIVGGVLTGGVGAVVGAAVGGKKKDNSKAIITLLEKETKRKILLHIHCDQDKLQEISAFPIANIESTNDILTQSVADEISKFKKLLDEGVITQEEFEKKKQELLGL